MNMLKNHTGTKNQQYLWLGTPSTTYTLVHYLFNTHAKALNIQKTCMVRAVHRQYTCWSISLTIYMFGHNDYIIHKIRAWTGKNHRPYHHQTPSSLPLRILQNRRHRRESFRQTPWETTLVKKELYDVWFHALTLAWRLTRTQGALFKHTWYRKTGHKT